MKLFVCMCILYAVADATFFGLSGGGGGYYGTSHYSHKAPAKVIKLKVINEARGNSVGYQQHNSASQIYKVIVQRAESTDALSNNGHNYRSAPVKVVRLIHENSGSLAAPSFNAPVVAPQNVYLPPVQAPPQVFSPPALHYAAPSPQTSATASQHLRPTTFTAPRPVAAVSHVPAQSYGAPF